MKKIYGLDHVADFLEVIASGLRKGQIASALLTVDDDGVATAQVRLTKPESEIDKDAVFQYGPGERVHRPRLALREDDEKPNYGDPDAAETINIRPPLKKPPG